MNKKILISLSVIAAVAAIAIGGTIAYFSDTETSTGNSFTAGRLDLIVDIDGVVQNPLSGPIFTAVTDMKPGDSGEHTISLTVDNNPACGFISFNLTSDKDNSCTEPEIGDEPGCVAQGTGEGTGELNDNVVWTIWLDQGLLPGWQGKTTDPKEGDNIWQGETYEPVLTTGNIVASKSWSIGELPVSPTTQYYGIKWELPTAVNNIAQSDSFAADMIFSAKQKRNQDFGSGVGICPAVGVVNP